MIDYSRVKLGKKEARIDPRTLRLGRYLSPALPPPPDALDWFSGIVNWGMMLNDVLGNCTIAGGGHAVQTWTAATGPEWTVKDENIKKLYEEWCGYVDGDPSTDQGAVEIDVLNRWRKYGFSGHKLEAYADPDPGDILHIKQSIQLFGLCYIGLSLPITAQHQNEWDVVSGSPYASPGSWGGHCVIVNGYDSNSLTCVTWGSLKKMTWDFWAAYCDEAHTLLSGLWLNRAPADFHFGDLMKDLQQVAG